MRAAGVTIFLLLWAAAAEAAPEPPRLDLGRLHPAFAQSAALRESGLARTAVEARLRDRDASLGLGFLCGRQPSAVTSGGAAAYGVDPHGRFVGAQLRMSFR